MREFASSKDDFVSVAFSLWSEMTEAGKYSFKNNLVEDTIYSIIVSPGTFGCELLSLLSKNPT